MNLPTTLTKDVWFYDKYKEECNPLLGRPYLSYSSINAWTSYRSDFIKNKFARINLEPGIYADFGSYVGGAVENGKFGDNPYGFQGQSNLDLTKYKRDWEYEKFVSIDMGSYVIIGFIDYVKPMRDGVAVIDVKTAGKTGKSKYEKKDYIQTTLYGHALQQKGLNVVYTGVELITREGSHFKGPMTISKKQEHIELPFNEERIDYALKLADKMARQISDYYTTYQKIFK